MKYWPLLFIFLCVGCNVKNVEIEKDISERINAANNAFQIAEDNIFKDDVPIVPIVPNDAIPDPDVDKCACKGTGKISHGDGHSTPCPYHAVGFILNSN